MTAPIIDGLLSCPKCEGDGCGYLHQGSVDIYERRVDSDTTLHTKTVRNQTITTLIEGPCVNNPSYHRHGMSITFSCETCGENYSLKIYQHKRRTFVCWGE